VRRPFANGLEAIVNYTWSHASDTDQVQGNFGTFYGGNTVLDPNNVRGENGLSDIDIRNRFTITMVYQPHILEDNKIVKYALDDWLFAASEIASGGQPIAASMSGTVYSGNISASSYGNEGNIYGGAMSSSSGSATTGRPPQIGRNSLIGPGFNDFDARLSRNFPIHEKIYLQFSADAFNLLNHKIVTGVQGQYSTYLSGVGTTSGAVAKCVAASIPTGSVQQGCIVPSTATGLSSFGAVSGTSNGLYTARQMQFNAKLFF
jgi:hypothetical protein